LSDARYSNCPSTCEPGLTETRRPGRPRRMRLDECHTIHTLLRVPTWTLVFAGRRVRNWGFYIPGRYVHHRTIASSAGES